MTRITLLLGAAALVAAGGCTRKEPVVAPVAPVVVAPAVDVTSPLYGPMFLQLAASANLWEIRSSAVAHQLATSPAVHSFASMIEADHGPAAAHLAAAAQAAGLAPPPQAMMPEDQQMLAQLQATPRAGFDLAYRDMQVAAHQKAVSLFQNYAASGDNATLRATAAQMLPKLQHHLALAQSLAVAGPPPATRPGERG